MLIPLPCASCWVVESARNFVLLVKNTTQGESWFKNENFSISVPDISSLKLLDENVQGIFVSPNKTFVLKI